MYERVNPNHILAAPNKYYEGLALGRPVITTVGTLVGDKVNKYDTGYCIDEQYESLDKLISDIDRIDISSKSLNASDLWNNTYKDYVKNFMETEYIDFIRK